MYSLIQVTHGLYRSAMPVGDDWLVVRGRGISHVLRLIDGSSVTPGIEVNYVPLPDDAPVSDEQLAQADSALDALLDIAKTDRSGVLVHCLAGENRTGHVIARYRVRREGWTKFDALEEWDRLGNPRYAGPMAAWERWRP